MAVSSIQQLRQDPDFIQLERRRNALSWSLAVLMVVIYGAFIFLVAFRRDIIARPIGAGVITLGLPLGLGVILIAIALTAIYVWRANTEFDALTRRVREKHQ